MSTQPSENPGDFPEANDDIEFAFNFNGQLKSPPLSAAELFDGGKIKPLKLLPRSQYWGSDSPQSPRSPKRMITKAFIMSPRRKKKIDSHSLLIKRKEKSTHSITRQKGSKYSSATLTDVSNMVSPPTKIHQSSKETASLSSSSFSRSTSSSASSLSSSWSRKWKFLFRSMSEGHATSKDDYAFGKIHNEDLKNLSFGSEDSVNPGSRGNRRKKGRVSAHEWHYKKNRAAAEERRRKTFLPYKKNLLSCTDLDPGVRIVSRWIGVGIKC